ncbi:MAG: hypothetical protein ACREAK_09920 [Nitrosarchaeum sp.]
MEDNKFFVKIDLDPAAKQVHLFHPKGIQNDLIQKIIEHVLISNKRRGEEQK